MPGNPASIVHSLLPEEIAAALDVLSPDQVAAVLGVNPITLRRWRKEGRGPPSSHEGRNTWYRAAALKAWLIEREQAPAYRYRRNGADGEVAKREVPDPADRQSRRPVRAASRSRTLAQRPRPPP